MSCSRLLLHSNVKDKKMNPRDRHEVREIVEMEILRLKEELKKELKEELINQFTTKEEVKRMIHEGIEEHVADRHYVKLSPFKSERAYL